jgi:hypothetical protein
VACKKDEIYLLLSHCKYDVTIGPHWYDIRTHFAFLFNITPSGTHSYHYFKMSIRPTHESGRVYALGTASSDKSLSLFGDSKFTGRLFLGFDSLE